MVSEMKQIQFQEAQGLQEVQVFQEAQELLNRQELCRLKMVQEVLLLNQPPELPYRKERQHRNEMMQVLIGVIQEQKFQQDRMKLLECKHKEVQVHPKLQHREQVRRKMTKVQIVEEDRLIE